MNKAIAMLGMMGLALLNCSADPLRLPDAKVIDFIKAADSISVSCDSSIDKSKSIQSRTLSPEMKAQVVSLLDDPANYYVGLSSGSESVPELTIIFHNKEEKMVLRIRVTYIQGNWNGRDLSGELEFPTGLMLYQMREKFNLSK